MARVLHVASECYPLIKTGGLADVVGALPAALIRAGCDARVMVPGFPAVMAGLNNPHPVKTIAGLFGGPATVVAGEAVGTKVYALDAPHLYDRPGNPYLDETGTDWSDNAFRFAALSRVASERAVAGLDGWAPDIVHAHDWQAGLVPAYLKQQSGSAPATVMTIHNIAFQGLAPAATFPLLGLDASFFTPSGLEYYGQVSFLKSGLVFADRLTTVSPTYAQETRTAAFGMGLEGVLGQRGADYSGILNGVDIKVWNPSTDRALAARYSRRNMAGKADNKAAVQASFGLTEAPDSLLFGIVSRLTAQKGIDIVLDGLARIVGNGGQVVVLGSGEPALETRLAAAAETWPGRVGVSIGYDEALSHLIQGGADAILVPSRFEPCGLTQLYGLRYGAVPVVARTGGLADTVIEANDAAIAAGTATGFQFSPIDGEGFGFVLERVFEAWADQAVWTRIRARGMAHPISWDKSAARYVEVYRNLLSGD